MARAGSRKKKFVVKIELGAKGLLATGVVVFCVLLWMFLLGIWAGDHLAGTGAPPEPPPPAVPFPVPAGGGEGGAVSLPRLDEPAAAPREETARPPEESGRGGAVGERVSLVPRAEKRKVGRPAGRKAAPAPAGGGKAAAGGSFFALQVGAYRDKANAIEDCARLVARGLDAFYRDPSGASRYTRVYVGRYAAMDEARAAAARLEKEKGIKSFVVMIPGRGAGR